MTENPLDLINTPNEKHLEYWENSDTALQVSQALKNKPLVTIVGSPYTFRSDLIKAIKKELLTSTAITLSVKELKENTDINNFWGEIFHSIQIQISEKSKTTATQREPFQELYDLLKTRTSTKSLYWLIDDFHYLQFIPFEESLIEGFKKFFDIPNLHILALGDVYPCGEDFGKDFPFYDLIAPIRLADVLQRDQLRTYIESLSDFEYDPRIVNSIIDLTGKEPSLIKKICLEIQTDHNKGTKKDGFENVYREVIEKSGINLFKEQWLCLTYIEQMSLLIITMCGLYEDISAEDIREQLIGTTAVDSKQTFLEMDFARALEILARRNILYYDQRKNKYVFNNELIKLWLQQNKELEPDQSLSRILLKSFAAFSRNLLSPNDLQFFNLKLESSLAKNCMPLNAHNKEKCLDDIALILNPNFSFQQPVILHLSDIQFGEVHPFDKDQESQNSLSSVLLDDILKNYPIEHLPKPNTIVISGDVANTCMPSEYKTATEFIHRLSSGLQIDASRIIIVPGNHDVNYLISHGISHAYNTTSHSYEKDGRWRESLLYPSRMAPYEEFLNELYKNSKSQPISRNHSGRYTIYDLTADFRLLVVGFDSCYTVDHERSKGSILVEDIIKAEDEISRISPDTVLYKIAVWHHNINSIEGRDDFLTNWSTVQEYLFHKFKYQLALHGHIHRTEDRYQPYDPTQGILGLILGAGAIGVEEGKRAGSPRFGHMPLSYTLIQFGTDNTPNKIRVFLREARGWDTEPIKWVPGQTRDFNLPNYNYSRT